MEEVKRSDWSLSSLNRPFGSGIVTPSGVLLNSQILDFSWPNKTDNFSPNPVSCSYRCSILINDGISLNCPVQLLVALHPTAQQHPARQEADVLPDTHGSEARSGSVWHLLGRGLVQRRQSPQWNHTGAPSRDWSKTPPARACCYVVCLPTLRFVFSEMSCVALRGRRIRCSLLTYRGGEVNP